MKSFLYFYFYFLLSKNSLASSFVTNWKHIDIQFDDLSNENNIECEWNFPFIWHHDKKMISPPFPSFFYNFGNWIFQFIFTRRRVVCLNVVLCFVFLGASSKLEHLILISICQAPNESNPLLQKVITQTISLIFFLSWQNNILYFLFLIFFHQLMFFCK